jgi:hypothetical protein
MKTQLLVAATLAALGVQAQAGTLGDGNLTISGFGTLAAAKSDTDTAQFARYNQAVGVKDGVRIGLDSNLGLQATYRLAVRHGASADPQEHQHQLHHRPDLGLRQSQGQR